MAKLTLADVSNLLGSPTVAANTINSNNSLIEAALENTVSRDGTVPNQMNADFDMNGKNINNVGLVATTTLTIGGTQVEPTTITIADSLKKQNNLSDVSSIPQSRTNLGLGSAALADSSAFATAIQGARADSALQSTAIGVSIQAYDAGLTSIANLTTSSDQIVYTTAPDVWNTTALTSFGRSLIDDADAATSRTTLGLGSASTQGTGTSGHFIPFLDGANTWSALQTISSLSTSNATITGGTITNITDLAVADGGTGASTAANARTNLGAAASGANSDITALSGLTTALSVAQGGTAGTSASAARTNLGLSAAATMAAVSNGTFTPVLRLGGATTGITYGTQSGVYTRIGSLIFYVINITLTSKGTATGALDISGLPFAAGASSYGFGVIVGISNMSSWTSGQAQILPSSSIVTPFAQNTSAIQGYSDTNLTNTSVLRIVGVYDMGSLT